MNTARRAILWIPVCLLAALPLGNCGTAEPPLDQLELRDALLSEPTVIAALPREAQQRLAGRFWAAVALPEPAQRMPPAEVSAPEPRLRRLDAQRQQRGQDAFLMGSLGRDAAAETLLPFFRPARSAPTAPLPQLEGPASTATQAQEARALAGRAGAAIEDLRNVSGAAQLERVTGWPTAVLVIDDRIYVNATWLTAVAALEPGEPLAPAQSGALTRSGGPSSGRQTLLYGGIYALPEDAHGAIGQHLAALGSEAEDPTAVPSSDPAASGGFGSCSSCSSSSCSSSSSSCSSSSSSCSSSSTNCTVNLCSSSADKQCCRACALTPLSAGPDLAMVWMTLWLSLPLGFLASVDLRTRVRARTRDGRADRER
jgi:hypothetical protein